MEYQVIGEFDKRLIKFNTTSLEEANIIYRGWNEIMTKGDKLYLYRIGKNGRIRMKSREPIENI